MKALVSPFRTVNENLFEDLGRAEGLREPLDPEDNVVVGHGQSLPTWNPGTETRFSSRWRALIPA